MPAPSKPLVSPRLLAREAAALLQPTDAQRQAAAQWAQTAANPAFAGQNEKPHQGKFLADLFGTVLGYRQFTDAPDAFELKAETASAETVGSKTPDATLGRYGTDGTGRTVAVVELKAPGADLDAPPRRAARLTPVEQAFGYVPKFDGCRWVVVSNFTLLRLYRAHRGEGYAVEIRIADLGDDQTLRELLAVLHRDRLLGSGSGPSPTDRLAEASRTQEVEITAAFYSLYRDTRLGLFRDLIAHNAVPAGIEQADHERALLAAAQTLLDRTLFVCFCEDTGLLPRDVLQQALTAAGTGFVQTSRWDQLRGLFRAVDQGNVSPRINAYNGGLFAPDPVLDTLAVPDDALAPLLEIAGYDFNSDLSVDILGRIFERSIADLEALHAAIEGADAPGRSKRKSDGVFYTPEFVTRFIVTQTVGAWLAEQFEAARADHDPEALPASHTKQRAQAERALWLDYQDRLRRIKVLDPACGSGAFLVAAFDYLHAEYQRVNRKLASFEGGQAGLFDLDRQILQENLYGVDVNAESVEITRLSLWLKTARTDRPLSNLDQTIRTGDSLVAPPTPGGPTQVVFEALPPETQARAFDWHAAFSGVFGASVEGAAPAIDRPSGGFDCVLGNPPYVRAEWFTDLKPYLAQAFEVYHGSADLYAYFVEQGARLLAPGGKLAYIVSNKWMRASYGEPLRAFLAARTVAETILDFGHAPVFEDTDTFPVILTLRVPTGGGEEDPTVQVATVPRERLREAPLAQFVAQEAFGVSWSRFSADPWSLDSEEARDLVGRIQHVGTPLAEFAGVEPYSGIKTGLNDAFLVEDADKRDLIAAGPSAADILVPYVRGSDIERWAPDWKGQWMIALASSANRDWPWTGADDPEAVFRDTYPSVYARFEPLRDRLAKRTDQGVRWWELRSCDYYDLFDAPKISYQQLQALADQDEEVRFTATMEVYLALYEGLVKAIAAFPVYCLDLIAGPTYLTKPLGRDLVKKSIADYVHDDISYKQTKLKAAAALGLTRDLSVLLTGVEPHLRNSIAHKRFEFTEDGRVTFRDLDRKGTVVFERTMRLGAFEWLTKTLRVNFFAQGAALSLFPFEFRDAISARPEAPAKSKAIKHLVYHACQEVQLEPTDIRLDSDRLTCTLYRSSALDNPSSVVANVGGVRMGQDFAPLPLALQLETLAVHLAERNALISMAELCVQDHGGAALGHLTVDIAGLRDAIKAGAPFPPFASFVLDSGDGQPSASAEAPSV